MKHMDTDQLRHIVKGQGEALLELAERIGSSGRPFKEQERQLIRVAMFPVVKESQDIISSAFVSGSKEWMETEMERLQELITVADVIN